MEQTIYIEDVEYAAADLAAKMIAGYAPKYKPTSTMTPKGRKASKAEARNAEDLLHKRLTLGVLVLTAITLIFTLSNHLRK